MLSFPLACALLLLVDGPDLYEEPLRFDIGSPPPCMTDADCFVDTPLCNVETGECVACLGPDDCPEGWGCTPTGTCRDACEVDGDCEGANDQTLCHPDTGFCVQCVDAEHCLEEQYCGVNGFCLNDHCTPGETICVADTIMQCLEDGGSTMEVEVCPELCEESGGGAQCGSAGSTGGSGGAGSGNDDSAGSTTGAGSGTAGGAEAGGSGGTSLDDDADDKGCACRAAPSGGQGWSWAGSLALVVLGGTGLARRRG
ncbi:MYXO-CTERM sorting domain-containing protein [Paraliomyxa miuraensis]|uniref:MYXO-CTERM sorting domain-containing protein n=1 Tax=Paraliomyxa miuraensis TaxID=376150 RepID=UPI002257E0F6|nr:MYXO-CTERM sorting domain-containing protein [Paraliomyxa miuraensis]MCX4243471.1 MYXO-CTERM sorting domain-containing protein [Paraliomyxa miuraensis]